MHEDGLLAALRRFEEAHGLRLAGVEALAATVRVASLAPRAAAFEIGQPCGRIHLVRSGLLKQLYLKEDGSEWIKSFAGPGDLFACPASFKAGGVTTFASIAIESSVVESVAYAGLERLADTDPGWQKALRYGFQKLAELKIARERDLLMLSAAQAYDKLCAESPALVARIPQKDLAAFLGVTAVGLNRIAQRAKALRT